MKTLLRYYGGQTAKIKKLLELVPQHKTYVEVFGGAGHFLFLKEPSECEVYNDIDRNLVNFFRVLQDEEKYRKLIHRLRWTLYSREEFYKAKRILFTGTSDELESAWALYVTVRQSFSGTLKGGWSFDVRVPRGLPSDFYDQTWLEKEFAAVRRRLRNVHVECLDWRDVLKLYDAEETFFFLDPPYPPSTVRSKNVYLHNLTEEDHMELADRLKKLTGKFLLITYGTDYYDAMGVFSIPIKSRIFAAKKKDKDLAVTKVYMNYRPPRLDEMVF